MKRNEFHDSHSFRLKPEATRSECVIRGVPSGFSRKAAADVGSYATPMQIHPRALTAGVFLLFITGAVPNGQAPASVTAKPALAEPSIAADGSEIAFVSGGDIWTVAAAGGQARLLDLACGQRHASRLLAGQVARGVRLHAHRQWRHLHADRRHRRCPPADVRRLRWSSWMAGRATGSGSTSRRAPAISRAASTTSIACRPTAARRCRSAATATPTSTSRRRRPTDGCSRSSARGIASGQWWRHGHSHIDEAEIWIRDLTAGDVPTAWRALTNGGAKELWPMWAADGQVAALRVRPRRRREHLADARRRPARRAQLTRFTDGRVLWPSITDRRRRRGVRAQLRDLEARRRQRTHERAVDRADRRARGPGSRASAADLAVRRSGALARRTQGRVHGARRGLRRLGEGRRRRGARHHDPGRRSRSSHGRPTRAGWCIRRSAMALRAS